MLCLGGIPARPAQQRHGRRLFRENRNAGDGVPRSGVCRGSIGGVCVSDTPPEPANPAPPSTIPRSGAAEAAELKRRTLARLEAYRRADGLTSFTPLAKLCDEVDGKAVTPEMLGRMLGRERFSVTVWRAVAAALDKMERKKGADADGKDD